MFRRDRFSRIWCWPMKSTEHHRRCKARCWKRCKNGRLRSATRPSPYKLPSSCWLLRIRLNKRAPIPLPEAQVDRFMMKLVVEYPKYSEEREMIARITAGSMQDVQPVVDSEYVLSARDVVKKVHVDEKIQDYVLNLVVATRDPSLVGLNDMRNFISYGASPRAGLFLIAASQAYAFIKGSWLRHS